MPRYRFDGHAPEVFPTILTDAGTLVLKPGQTVDLDGPLDHARLTLVRTAKKPARHTGRHVIVDVADDPEPDAEPVDSGGINDDDFDDGLDGEPDPNTPEV